MPELILNDANPERIARLARDLLPDGPIRQAQLDAFAELRGSLMPDDCIQQSARRIVALGA
jgi:lipid A disaccharide synthetase